MTRETIRPSDEPLTSTDLALCRRALDAVCAELRVERDSEEGERLASIVIQLYRHGVRDEDNLRIMADAAGGVLSRDEERPA